MLSMCVSICNSKHFIQNLIRLKYRGNNISLRLLELLLYTIYIYIFPALEIENTLVSIVTLPGSMHPFCCTFLYFYTSLLFNTGYLVHFGVLGNLVGIPVNHGFFPSLIQSLNSSSQNHKL